MKYVSTRGSTAPLGFIESVLMGLADDGGLLVPEHLPQLSEATLSAWSRLSFQELTAELLSLFTGDEIPRADLVALVAQSYATFRHEEVTPVHRVDDGLYVLELFHGPTWAFKDVALQLLGNMYAYIAERTGSVIHILGATSGDTGASAIEGVRGKPGVRICILYPDGKVSRVQELQMTTVRDDNVLNLAIRGTFDDAQRLIKELFSDLAFKGQYHLRAINSINILRILAQTTYYFYAYFRVQAELTEKGAQGRPVHVSVPTGNFGDIFAGFLARRMGLPLGKLVVATNENNILARFVASGTYRPSESRSTHSPSMDIQVASNFERYLYYLYGENPARVKELMAQFSQDGQIEVPADDLALVQADFVAASVSNAACLDTIRDTYRETGYLLDPHTACGVAAAAEVLPAGDVTVALATAHPAKFDESVRLSGVTQTFPDAIAALDGLPTRQQVVDATPQAVRAELERLFAPDTVSV